MTGPLFPNSLLVRSPLLPDESLASLLVRLSQLNRYETMTTLAQVVKARSGLADTVIRPQHPETYAILSTLTGLPILDLYTATTHSLAPVLAPPNRKGATLALAGRQLPLLSHKRVKQHLYYEGGGQFCPHCLLTSPYHRLSWTPLTTTACLTHGCLLLNRCPGCRKRTRIKEVVTHQCASCKFDLRYSPTQSVTHDPFSLFAQATIQSWWGVSTPPRWVSPYQAPNYPPNALHSLLEGLAWAVIYTGGTLSTMHHPFLKCETPLSAKYTLSPLMRHIVLTTAFKGLVNWPHGFHQFLDAFRQEMGEVKGQVKHDFSALYTVWLADRWNYPAFSFVRQAFEDFLVVHRYHFFPKTARYRFSHKL